MARDTSNPGADGDEAATRDVVIVGGGPAGCAAGVFTARYGLDTVVFDRGRSSLRQCAHLENYLGFPAGVDVETFYALAHDHAREAGCEFVADVVTAVDRAGQGGEVGSIGDASEDVGDGDPGDTADAADARFRVETQDGRTVGTRYVVAATRYDGEYLRPFADGEMFETYEHDGECRERFDRSYAAADGTTPVEGLFVASPSEAADRQAIVAAGRGARVGLAVIAAARRAAGYPDCVATHYDWVRRDAERDDEWRNRDRWREQFEVWLPEDHDIDGDRVRELREREIDRRLATYRTDEEIEAAAERAQRRILEHLDDELVLERARELQGAPESAGAGD